MDRGEMFKMPSFPSVTAMICWPQRESTGRGGFKCSSGDVHSIFAGTSDIVIGTRYARFEIDQRYSDSIFIANIDTVVSALLLETVNMHWTMGGKV
ncbi:hypothetical protein Bca52824_026886 [Brassica carinata]|uniref:DEAH11/12 RRM domain-containing protein n=1 Tax=Brassica carinata TaxID=52824 RepID=A0A8X7SIW4_BRACI|nr:hypothetical protein Bca52824_026886 [Brassica carinata]